MTMENRDRSQRHEHYELGQQIPNRTTNGMRLRQIRRETYPAEACFCGCDVLPRSPPTPTLPPQLLSPSIRRRRRSRVPRRVKSEAPPWLPSGDRALRVGSSELGLG